MAKKFEELTISDDFMFCVVMQNSRFCKKFLETILGVKIARIEYPDAQKTINITPDAKSVRLDVYCILRMIRIQCMILKCRMPQSRICQSA